MSTWLGSLASTLIALSNSHLKNLAIYKLSVDPQDSVGLRLLLSGISSDQGYWQDPRRRQSDWDGGVCTQLIVWDDQGFGDTLQNLGWIGDAARRVGTLRVLLRPSLPRLVSSCLPLPANCHLEVLDPDYPPGLKAQPRLVSFTFPSSLNGFHTLFPVAPTSNFLRMKSSVVATCNERAAHWSGLECWASQGSPTRTMRTGS